MNVLRIHGTLSHMAICLQKISDYRSNIYHKRNSSSTVHDGPFIDKSINNYSFLEKAFTLILDNMTHGHRDANVILIKRLKA